MTNSKKKTLTSAIILSIGSFASSANADLSNGSLGLDIVGNLNPVCLVGGVYPSCDFGAFDRADAGSYFDMGGNPAAALDGNAPLMLSGVAQSFSTADVGLSNPYPADNRSPFIQDWDFFGAKGTNGHIGIPVSGNDSIIDMSSWFVTWSEVPIIDMGGDAGAGDTGMAVLVCSGGVDPNTCELGESFTIDYAAHVPVGDPSGFGGVLYELHLQGTVVSTNDAPVATSDPLLAAGATGSTFTIDLASNVSDPDGPGVDTSSFQYTYTGTRSPAPTISINNSGIASYTDNVTPLTDTVTPDTFTYTVQDTLGDTSAVFTVNVSLVTGNIPPVAQNFSVGTDKDVAAVVDVGANVTDSDGTVDATTVATSNPVNGAVTNIDAVTGEVTFTPSAGFIGVASFDYTVDDDDGDTSNTATVTVNVNDPPVAGDTTVSVDRNSNVVVDVVALTTDTDGTVDPTSVLATQGTNGATSVDLVNGQVTYTPTFGDIFLGADQFTYTIKDNNGATSNSGTVTVNIVNALPVAVDDITLIDTSVNASVDIDVTSNDTDSDGTINNTTVGITTIPTNGNATVGGTGVITYTPNAGFVGSDTLQYTVNDNDSGVSNIATVFITASSGSDFCQNTPLTPESCFLQFNPGNITPQVTPVLGDGSYFTMEVQPGVPSPTALVSQNGLQLNTTQLASTDPLSPNIDQPWQFFGNLGVHQTVSAPTVTSDDGAGNVTLDFTGWNVSWNFIPSIDLSSGLDNGVATMTCYTDDLVTQTPGDCSAGNIYVLDYHATVPPGDPSGFGNVKYRLHLEGTVAASGVIFGPSVPPNTSDIQAIDGAGNTVSVQPGSAAIAAGNTTGTQLTAAETGVNDPLLNPNDGQQCLGGCVDFVVSGFTGDYVDIIYRLSTPLVDGAIYRKLISGIWGSLDASGSDQLGSNAEVSGACTNDKFSPGLIAGNQCIFLRIYDGGPNDADGLKNGKIVDPSGVLVAGSPNTPPGSTSGCSISSANIDLNERAEWFIVASFIIWLGLIGYRRNKTVS
jgi:Bacterial Ig domain